MQPPSDHNQAPLSYRDAGVDIDRGNRLVERIKGAAKSTARPGLLGGLGGFGGLFELPVDRYRKPVLVSGTDGVGTKLELAGRTGLHDGIGIDLVAMCVNDILTLGAEPLFFLDYLATGRLDDELAARVIEGIAEGCRQSGAALIGGETAEMPGMYRDEDYDLAGFCVGVVERDEIIDGTAIRPGDRLLGLASSGPHANGFSLIRKVLERDPGALERPLEVAGPPLSQLLMAPTRIYVSAVRHILSRFPGRIHGMAHITGGGLTENVPRVLMPGQRAEIRRAGWPVPPVFEWIRALGRVDDAEMQRTFNCGIGLVLAVEADAADTIAGELQGASETVFDIGRVVAASGPADVVLV